MKRTAFKPKPGHKYKGFKPPKPRPTLEELKAAGKVIKASSFVSKPRKRMKVRATPKPGQLTQLGLFRAIWDTRQRVSQVSGEPLVDPPEDLRDEEGMSAWISQFSHILPKGAYRAYKLRPENIILKTREEHALWERWKTKVLAHCDLDQVANWQRIVDLYFTLRDRANNITE